MVAKNIFITLFITNFTCSKRVYIGVVLLIGSEWIYKELKEWMASYCKFSPEDGGSICLRNVGHQPECGAKPDKNSLKYLI